MDLDEAKFQLSSSISSMNETTDELVETMEFIDYLKSEESDKLEAFKAFKELESFVKRHKKEYERDLKRLERNEPWEDGLISDYDGRIFMANLILRKLSFMLGLKKIVDPDSEEATDEKP